MKLQTSGIIFLVNKRIKLGNNDHQEELVQEFLLSQLDSSVISVPTVKYDSGPRMVIDLLWIFAIGSQITSKKLCSITGYQQNNIPLTW